MRKQTKLVAVLSTAALLAIGASMTSFAAQGWAEEDGTWVYYDRNGDRVTDKWAKSGNNWYYLDSDGEMAIDTLIEDSDNYYYVDVNGVMASNQWVASDNAERIDNTDGNAFNDGVYYFGGEDDGAMTVGWLQMDITYDEATNDYEIAPLFNDEEDQSRWFYFKSNGKKYAFDQYGAMVAEQSLDIAKATANLGTNSTSAVEKTGNSAQYSKAWRYFNSVEDGARVSKGWFKVVAAEHLNEGKYNDDEDAWYYADGSGNLYAGEFKTIKGKKYAFRNDGRMVNGLKFIKGEGTGSLTVVADDDLDDHLFDDEDRFDQNAPWFEANGYHCYYFGDGDDGAMRTNKTSVAIDGDNYNFYFEKSGGHKGAGVTGEEDDKLYQSGMLLKADSDDKYIVVEKTSHYEGDKVKYTTYRKLDDAKEFMNADGVQVKDELDGKNGNDAVNIGNGNTKKAEDLSEAYSITYKDKDAKGDKKEYILVNTSGKIVDGKGKNKDGSDYYYVTEKKANGENSIVAIYVED